MDGLSIVYNKALSPPCILQQNYSIAPPWHLTAEEVGQGHGAPAPSTQTGGTSRCLKRLQEILPKPLCIPGISTKLSPERASDPFCLLQAVLASVLSVRGWEGEVSDCQTTVCVEVRS